MTARRGSGVIGIDFGATNTVVSTLNGDGTVRIEKTVRRADFEAWIAPELAAMDRAVDEALARAGLAPDGIDRVFLTGGSSFVPAVRRLFARRFGDARVEGGGELVSIASGLAYMGAEPDLDQWSQRAPSAA